MIVIVYFDNTLIHAVDPDRSYVEVIQLDLDYFQKYSLFANLKKDLFHKDKL